MQQLQKGQSLLKNAYLIKNLSQKCNQHLYGLLVLFLLFLTSSGTLLGQSANSDGDGDGICDDIDNCINVYNPVQEDYDGDGTGDACDDSNDVCDPRVFVYWDLDDCSVIDGSNDYSEFTPALFGGSDGIGMAASLLTHNGGHSCTFGSSGKTLCASGSEDCTWTDNNFFAYEFSVTLNPASGDIVFLTGLTFFEQAPEIVSYVNGANFDNDPPAFYGIRVLKDGQEIYQSIDNSTTSNWTEEVFNFTDPDFSFTDLTVFKFELLGYCSVDDGNNAFNTWEIDEIRVRGCAVEESSLTCIEAGGDSDGDGICNNEDNCVTTPNPNQQDSDNDGIGDTCEGPSPCACTIDTDGLANISCTGTDAISLDLNITGINAGAIYNLSVSGGLATSISPTSGIYGIATTFTLNDNSAGGGDVTITITDVDDPTCTREVVVTDPGTCVPICSIGADGLANVTCTGTDAISLELTATGTDIGATYNVSVSGASSISPTSGTYNTTTTFTLNDNSAGGGDVTITLTDVDDISCTRDVVVTDPGTCAPIVSYDVSLTKTVDLAAASLGSPVVFTIVVENLEDAITGATVNDVLPAGLTYNGVYTASTGTYDGTNWTIGDMAVGATETITITATADAEGVMTNEAVVSINETETNLTNNEDKDCVSVPVQVCDNEAVNVDITAEAGLTTYQWYKDGVAIMGATNQMYIAIEAGTYTYTVDGAGPTGDCEAELCCPIVIEQISCCAPRTCLPVTVIRLN